MTQTILIGLAALVFVVLWFRSRGASASLLIVLGALTLAPVILGILVDGADAQGTIATSGIVLYTYHVALFLALLATRGWPKSVPISLIALVPVLILINAARGVLEPHVIAGLIQLTFVALAWGVGAAIAKNRYAGGISDRELAIILFIMVAVQAVVVGQELLGFRSAVAIEVGDDEFSRLRGLAGASGNLGKVLTLFLVFWLPLTQSADKLARRLTYLGLGLSAVMVGLSLSRVNAFAFFVAIGIWFLLAGGGKNLSRRILVPLVFGLISLPFVEVLVLRQVADPDGGSRPRLLVTAMEVIGANPLIGVGPNNYLEVAGLIDPLAAGGLPVHSTGLLLLAELGIIGLALLAFPLAQLIVSALRTRRQETPQGLIALAVCAVLPGVALIAATGWGLAARGLLILLFFVAGYAAGAISTAATKSAPELVSPSRLVPTPLTDVSGRDRRTIGYRSADPVDRGGQLPGA